MPTSDTTNAQVLPISIPAWMDLPWLVHGFSTRRGGVTTAYGRGRKEGDLNLGFTGSDKPSNVGENRERFLAALTGLDAPGSYSLATLRQTHSVVIHRAGEPDGLPLDQASAREGDGLLTDVPGVLLGILTADCVPVLLVDVRLRAVGAFHAGWRGTVQGIVEQGVARMKQELGSEAQDLVAAVGPAIGGCCYRVGAEVRQRFEQSFSYANELFMESEHGWKLNLGEANRRQLLSSGLRDEAITVNQSCTSCETDRFFSHRAEQGATGRMMAVVGARPGV